jgi:hypothetical protein
MSNKVCLHCNHPLMRIHYGEELIACIHCNRWGYPGDEKLIMKLVKEDLEALRLSRGLRR